jgi:hypothetical protein
VLLALALTQDNCGRQQDAPPAEKTPEPPPAEEPAPPSGESGEAALRARLEVSWEEGPPVSRLRIEYMVENRGAEPVTLSFRNSGRVCGVVRDADGGVVHEFPQITLQVMGEETFPPGEGRVFRSEVRRTELGEPPSLSYTVDAWLCGYTALKQQGTAKTRATL